MSDLQKTRSALLRVSQAVLTAKGFKGRYAFKRFAKCGRVPFVGSDIDVCYSPSSKSSHFSNVIRCGSVWLCPECSSKISMVRCDEMKTMIANWTQMDKGNVVYMLTLTHSHTNKDTLVSLLENQSAALIKFWENGSVKRLLKSIGCVGRSTTFEITYGEGSGWHPHRHILLFCKKQNDLSGLSAKLCTYWGVALRKFKLYGNTYSLDLQGASEASQYVTKLALEVSLPNLKRSPDGSKRYTPFALLSLLLSSLADPPAWAVKAFQEYALATRGKHQFSFSKGLKTLLGIVDVSDEELAEQEPPDSITLFSIPYAVFKQIYRDFRLYQSLLEIASRGDPFMLRMFLQGRGLLNVA